MTKRTQSDKVLKDKAFEIANDAKHSGYERSLAAMAYKIFDKKSKGVGIKNKIKENQQLANELHKPISSKFEKSKVHGLYEDNAFSADLADVQLLRKYNKGIKYLLCAIDIFSKYAWVIPLKDKKRTTIANAFRQNLNNLKRKPKKIWVH